VEGGSPTTLSRDYARATDMSVFGIRRRSQIVEMMGSKSVIDDALSS
jgi:hypothetical protein